MSQAGSLKTYCAARIDAAVHRLREVVVEVTKPFQSPRFRVSLFWVPLYECVQKNCVVMTLGWMELLVQD